MIDSVIYVLGFAYLFRLLYKLFVILRIHFTPLDKRWGEKFGEQAWAVVTGCTGGIGKQFCETLAELGFNIVMVARNERMMEEIKKEIQEKWGREVRLFKLDFEKAGYEEYKGIEEIVKGVNVRILVNNVGFPSLSSFSEQSPLEITNQMQVNISSSTYLTSILLPHFLTSSTSKPVIINMSSMSIDLPFSSTPIYVATKAYLDAFSRSLSAETSKKIDVLSVRAGVVSTPATKYSKEVVAISTKQCVEGVLKAVGKVEVTYGHLVHNLQGLLVEILGERLCRWMIEGKARKVRQDLRRKND